MHQAPVAASKMVPLKLTFSPLSRRQIEADFSRGHITSDACLLLLREVDSQHRLTQRPAGTDRPFWRCWCDRQPVDYIVGIARNQRLEALAAPAMDKVRGYYKIYDHKLAATFRFGYQAEAGARLTWWLPAWNTAPRVRTPAS